LANILISFILTGVVGTAFTQYFFDRRQDEQRRITQLEHRQEALGILMQHMKEYQVRFEILIEAFESNATPEEIEQYKNAHDESLIAWRMDRHRLLILVKDLLSRSEYEKFLLTLESQLEEDRIDPIRRCMDDVFAEIEDINRAKELLEDCSINEKTKKATECIDAVFNELHEVSMPLGTKARIDDVRRAELAERVHKACTN